MIAASTASSAEPPRDRMDQPAARAFWQPSLQAAAASSGISQAPPCTMSEGCMAARIVRQGSRTAKLEPKIQEEKKESGAEENGAAVDAPARMAGETANETGGDRFAGQLRAKSVEGAGKSVPDEAAAKGSELVIHPDGNFNALRPQDERAGYENRVTKNGQETKCRTRAPTHRNHSQPGSSVRCEMPRQLKRLAGLAGYGPPGPELVIRAGESCSVRRLRILSRRPAWKLLLRPPPCD